MKALYKLIFLNGLLMLFCLSVRAQNEYNTVTTSASFLLISPDARNAGVAEAGTGLMADANSNFVNGAKISFAGKTGLSLSYVPWLRQLDKDLQLGNISAFRQLNDRDAVGVSVKYLNLGSISFRDENGNFLQQYKASEFALDATYSRKFGEGVAVALAGRYIRSDLGKGTFNGMAMDPVSAFAVDISVYSERTGNDSRVAWGVSLTNIGTKMKYSSATGGDAFLPMNLRAGAGYSILKNRDNTLTFLLDVNKLMVPTLPRYKLDADGMPTTEIDKGRDPERSVSSALFTSLFDAPGGFKEELSEFTVAGGMELAFRDQLFFRGGYFYENPEKGNRQHVSTGLGLKLNALAFDMSYLIPVSRRYVLRNGLKFTLTYRID